MMDFDVPSAQWQMRDNPPCEMKKNFGCSLSLKRAIPRKLQRLIC
jgi:hypothetical protein